MATQFILVEDCSPLIQYAPANAWHDSQANDTLATSYSGGSYHVTSTQGATATFRFRGTGFTMTGGRRPGYGPFSVTLDGQQLFSGNLAPTSDIDFRNTLASTSGLSNDFHTVVLTNTGGAPVDIDEITFETQIGGTAQIAPSTVTTVDDNDSRITYVPPNAWSSDSNPIFHDGTLHFSVVPNATASFQFTGNAIAFYGNVSPDHADVSITIDDTVVLPSGSASNVVALRPRVLMHWADDLEDGQHTMTISKVQSTDTGPDMDVDSFVIYSQATTSPDTRLSDPDATSRQPINRTGFIVGLSVAGVVVALLLVIVGFFLAFRYRRKRHKLENAQSSTSPTTPILPIQMMESGLIQRPPSSIEGGNTTFPRSLPTLSPLRMTPQLPQRLSKFSIAPSGYGNLDGGETIEGSDPFNPGVPRPDVSPMRESLRTVPPAVVTDTTSPQPRLPRPPRPKRPPTLKIGSLDSLMLRTP